MNTAIPLTTNPSPLCFENRLPQDLFSPAITDLLTSDDPLSQTIQRLFSTTKIIYKAVPEWHRYVPGMHAIGGSYTPGTVTIFPFLFHATTPGNTQEIQRLTISKLMQEYAHVLQHSQYGSRGFYKHYIQDALRCHIEPLLLNWKIANLKHSYTNPYYFEGEAHHMREPWGHLLFIMTYIHLTTGAPFPNLDTYDSVANFLNRNTHNMIADNHASMIATLFADYFDEFQGRPDETLTQNQRITRSTHLRDYQIANQWNDQIENTTTAHPSGISVFDLFNR